MMGRICALFALAGMLPAPALAAKTPEMPPVIHKIGAVSKYVGGQRTDKSAEKKDPTHSKIDPEAEKKYEAAVKPLRDANNAFTKLANRYLRKHKAEDARQTQAWLYAWAKEDALSDMLSTIPDQLNFAYAVASLSSAYAQVKDAPGLEQEKNAAIEAWLIRRARDLAGSIGDPTQRLNASYTYRGDDPRNTSKPPHNIADWKAMAILQAARATGDKELFGIGVYRAREGLSDVNEHGLLRKEMGRGKRALQYHRFAATALAGAAALAAEGGVDLYEAHDGALARLLSLTLENFDDTVGFRRLSGQEELEPYPDDVGPIGHAGWLFALDPEKLTPAQKAKRDEILAREPYEKPFLAPLGGSLRLVYEVR